MIEVKNDLLISQVKRGINSINSIKSVCNNIADFDVIIAHETFCSGLAGLHVAEESKNALKILDCVEYPFFSERTTLRVRELGQNDMISDKLTASFASNISNQYDYLFCSSEGQVKTYKDLGNVTPAYLLRNCREYTDLPGNSNFLQSIGIRPEDKVILYSNKAYANGGIEILIEALSLLDKSYKAVVLGDVVPELKTDVETLTKKFKVSDRFLVTGMLDPSMVLPVTSEAILTLSLLEPAVDNHKYCLPNRIFDAIMAQRPILSFSGTEMADFIKANKVGMVVPKQDAKSLAETILKAEKKLPDFARRALQKSKKFCWEQESRPLIDCIKKNRPNAKKCLIIAMKDIQRNDRVRRLANSALSLGLDTTVIALTKPIPSLRLGKIEYHATRDNAKKPAPKQWAKDIPQKKSRDIKEEKKNQPRQAMIAPKEPLLTTPKKINIATICSQETNDKISSFSNTYYLTPKTWRQYLKYKHIDLLVVESAPSDAFLEWTYPLAGLNEATSVISSIVGEAEEYGIPTACIINEVGLNCDKNIIEKFDFTFAQSSDVHKQLSRYIQKTTLLKNKIDNCHNSPFNIGSKRGILFFSEIASDSPWYIDINYSAGRHEFILDETANFIIGPSEAILFKYSREQLLQNSVFEIIFDEDHSEEAVQKQAAASAEQGVIPIIVSNKCFNDHIACASIDHAFKTIKILSDNPTEIQALRISYRVKNLLKTSLKDQFFSLIDEDSDSQDNLITPILFSDDLKEKDNFLELIKEDKFCKPAYIFTSNHDLIGSEDSVYYIKNIPNLDKLTMLATHEAAFANSRLALILNFRDGVTKFVEHALLEGYSEISIAALPGESSLPGYLSSSKPAVEEFTIQKLSDCAEFDAVIFPDIASSDSLLKEKKISKDYPVQVYPRTNSYELTRQTICSFPAVSNSREKVTFSMASIPSRIKQLEVVINSLYHQVDCFNVYLNNYDDIPSYLLRDKINVHLSQDHGDLGAAGKFFAIDQVQEGYYFSGDDDFEYAPDYVSRMISSMSKYRNRCAMTLHGSIFGSPLEWYFERTNVFSARQCLPHDRFINLPGSGTLCFYRPGIDLTFSDFFPDVKCDLVFAVRALEQKIPIVSIGREKSLLKVLEVEKDGTDYFSKMLLDDGNRTALAVANDWSFENCASYIQPLIEDIFTDLDDGAVAELGLDVPFIKAMNENKIPDVWDPVQSLVFIKRKLQYYQKKYYQSFFEKYRTPIQRLFKDVPPVPQLGKLPQGKDYNVFQMQIEELKSKIDSLDKN